MSVYRPSYKDAKTGEVKRSRVWWYHFNFAGRHIQESTKSARKTIAVEAEKQRRRQLEKGFNNIEDTRQDRIRSMSEIADSYLEEYKLRNPRSATFAEYAVGHVKRICGQVMAIDVTDATVKGYQTARLKESASPKSINEEVGFFLRFLGEQGDFIRAKMHRQKTLKLKGRRRIAVAFTPEQRAAMLEQARKLRSPAIFPALTLALNCGVRDAELRGLQWSRVRLEKAVVAVGESKSDAGDGRTIPLNSEALDALTNHVAWYRAKFGETRPDWYVFPFGKPHPIDPTRPMVSLKTAWKKVRKAAGVCGRWHDNRHTFITDLAESAEASDETIRDLAGHVSPQMLKHYSHIRMEAKRRAVAAISRKDTTQTAAESSKGQVDEKPLAPAKESAKAKTANR